MFVEILEGRILPSAVLNPQTRMIEVGGTKRADVIECVMRRSKLRVTVNGVPATFRLKRVAGLDMNLGRGNDVVRMAANVPLRCTVDAGKGNDTLAGGSREDSMDGGAGDDKLMGMAADDELRGGEGWDTLFGGDDANTAFAQDDDRLYGGDGPDSLRGGAGRDGLFGGVEWMDTLSGGAGADRLLMPQRSWAGWSNEDEGWDDHTEGDALIRFYYMNDGKWTDAEIEAIDTGLAMLHLSMNHAQLLRLPEAGTSTGNYGRLSFTRDRDQTRSTNGGVINVGNGMFGSAWYTKYATIHEIGHHWDEATSNPWWMQGHDFHALSGWVRRKEGDATPPGKAVSTDGEWFYDADARFDSEYARTNPREDFAESFTAYLFPQTDSLQAPEKLQYMEAFLNYLKANPQRNPLEYL